MNSYTNYPNSVALEKERQQLERTLQTSAVKSAQSQLLDYLKDWGMALVNALAPSQEPRVKVIDSANGSIWKVYDPVSHQSHLFATEDELRIWLEERYYLP